MLASSLHGTLETSGASETTIQEERAYAQIRVSWSAYIEEPAVDGKHYPKANSGGEASKSDERRAG